MELLTSDAAPGSKGATFLTFCELDAMLGREFVNLPELLVVGRRIA